MLKLYTVWQIPVTRSEEYKAFIRTLPCCICGGQAEPHHCGPHGMGQKPSDFLTIPLCNYCHRKEHDTGTHLSMNFVDWREVALSCLVRWMEK